jgi:AbrB family looped-hinge helix DNA binding protein
MTSKGQITVPAEVRAKLGLRAGVKVDFVVNAGGEVVLRPRTADIRSLRGMLTYDGPPVSIEDMDRAIGDGVVEAFERSRS